MEHVADFSLVLLMFGESRFWRFGGGFVDDMAASTFALFSLVFFTSFMFQEDNVDSRGGFKATVDNQDSMS